MAQQIRTSWHRLRELVKAREVYFTSPPASALKGEIPLATRVDNYGIEWDSLDRMLNSFETLPLFVIDQELVKIASDTEFKKSLLDMKKADVLRLPFPAMMLEFNAPNKAGEIKTHIVFLRDLQATDAPNFVFEEPGYAAGKLLQNFQFYGEGFILERDKDGPYLVASPVVLDMSVRSKRETDPGAEDEPWLAFGGTSVPWLSDNETNNRRVMTLAQQTQRKDAGVVFTAMCCATLLMSTQGVAREVIECDKLNRKRTMSNKPPVPRHTYIHIGKVYRSANSDQADEYIPRRSPRPHWRRGHNRRIIEKGTKREGRVWKFIPPRLVAYAGNDDPIQPQTYKVKQ